MAKQAKVKLTPVQQWDEEVNKWSARQEAAIVLLVKATNRLKHAQRRLEMAKRHETKKRREAKLAQAPAKAAGSPGPKLLEDVVNGRAPKEFGKKLEARLKAELVEAAKNTTHVVIKGHR